MRIEKTVDMFGTEITVGDWVLYLRTNGVGGNGALMHGQISDILQNTVFDTEVFIYIKTKHENETAITTKPHVCVLFSDEEVTMRKLEANL